MQKKYEVMGMTCAACSAAVERSVKKLAGVNTVNVNLLSKQMVVEFDESVANSETIIKAGKVPDTKRGKHSQSLLPIKIPAQSKSR